LGQEILARKYETQYSQYQLETPDELRGKEDAISQLWVQLGELNAAKRATLDGDLARELEKERLRLEFATNASEYTRFCKVKHF